MRTRGRCTGRRYREISRVSAAWAYFPGPGVDSPGPFFFVNDPQAPGHGIRRVRYSGPGRRAPSACPNEGVTCGDSPYPETRCPIERSGEEERGGSTPKGRERRMEWEESKRPSEPRRTQTAKRQRGDSWESMDTIGRKATGQIGKQARSRGKRTSRSSERTEDAFQPSRTGGVKALGLFIQGVPR